MASDKPVPPYVSFGIFLSAVETLAQTTVPSAPLDRRVLDSLSGADYGALMSALRFMGMVDDKRHATQAYRDLVEAYKLGEPKFKQALLPALDAAYQPIMLMMDKFNGTIAQIEKAFKDAEVAPGQMLTKTIRFYIKAFTYCDVDLSPHITKAKLSRPKNGDSKPRKTKAKPDTGGGGGSHQTPAPTEMPTGFERMNIPGIVGAFIQYPTNLTTANCDVISAMVGALKAYATTRTGGKEKA